MAKDKARERDTNPYSGWPVPTWARPATQAEIIANAEAVKDLVLGKRKKPE